MSEKITFLSYDLNSPFIDDDLAIAACLKLGHRVETLAWKSFVPKKEDVVIIRSTWDYFQQTEVFLEKLSEIELSGARLLNSLGVVKWNYHKGYLQELGEKGLPVVPTMLFRPQTASLPNWKETDLVIKPAVSANSFKTKIVPWSQALTYMRGLGEQDWMCQPFIPGIRKGETSLVYFDKKFSHGVLKVPKSGDFRVQEEFGGTFRQLTVDSKLRELGEKILAAVPYPLLYARVDLVEHDGQMLLMELELIEPSLYFKHGPDSPNLFAQTLHSFLRR